MKAIVPLLCLPLMAAAVFAGTNDQQGAQVPATPAVSNHFIDRARSIVDALAGHWSIVWTTPDGRVIGKGREIWSVAAGGTAFTEENYSTVSGEKADEYAAMWWDGKAQKVHGIWCDDTINDEGCSAFDVVVTDAGVELRGEWEFQAKRQAWREVLHVADGKLDQQLYIGDPGTELKLVGKIRGTLEAAPVHAQHGSK